MVALSVIILCLVAVAAGLKWILSVRSPHGFPTGSSVRATDHIATLIQTLEPYMPSLHRNPARDRYRIALFLHPVDGHAPGRMIPLGRGFRSEQLQFARILGCDGRVVWCDVNGLIGVVLQSGKTINDDDLRRANPSPDENWNDTRRITVGERLLVTSADRTRVHAVDPETFKAVPATITPKPATPPFEPKPVDFLSAGARPSPTEWLGLHSTREAASGFKPRSWLQRFNRADDAREMRRFHRGLLGPELARAKREILSLAPLSDEEYLNAAFVRPGPDTDPIRLSGPDGFLIAYTSEPGLKGTLRVARVDTAGKPVWNADTGIDRFLLRQILPDSRFIAFIGTRPPVPDKVSEPLLVIVDVQSGAVSTTSLWR